MTILEIYIMAILTLMTNALTVSPDMVSLLKSLQIMRENLLHF